MRHYWMPSLFPTAATPTLCLHTTISCWAHVSQNPRTGRMPGLNSTGQFFLLPKLTEKGVQQTNWKFIILVKCLPRRLCLHASTPLQISSSSRHSFLLLLHEGRTFNLLNYIYLHTSTQEKSRKYLNPKLSSGENR